MRFQGKDWHTYKASHKLTLVCIIKSNAGHYRADVLDEHRQHNYHWLNQEETEALESSGYFSKHECYGEEVFRDGILTKLIREALKSIKKPIYKNA